MKPLPILLLGKLPLWIFLSFYIADAQPFTISGYITDEGTGERLLQARITDQNSQKGTLSNEYGFFSLSILTSKVDLLITYPDYEAFKLSFELDQDSLMQIRLTRVLELESVDIVAKPSLLETPHGVIPLDVNQLKSVPTLGGEPDLLKVVQLMPGVQSGIEGSTGIYVRGGGPDQNLFLLDEVPMYNVSHLFGFVSAFNPDMINQVNLIKGGFPARYGGRLSSILDIKMKEGNLHEFQTEGSVGLISSKLTLQGPLQKDKSSFIVSARRSIYDLITRSINFFDSENEADHYFFHDYYAKANYLFSDKDKLYVSFYAGQDRWRSKFKHNYSTGNSDVKSNYFDFLGWGNTIASLRWNHIFGSKLFANTTLYFNRYRFRVGSESDTRIFDTIGREVSNQFIESAYNSQIQDKGLKFKLQYTTNKHYLYAGIEGVHHRFTPGVNSFIGDADGVRVDTTSALNRINVWEFRAYVEDQIRFNSRLQLTAGLHISAFEVENKLYKALEPRISLKYALNDRQNISLAYTDMRQYIHLLTSSGLGLPTDLWVPPTKNVSPQGAQQLSIGTAYEISDKWDFSVEGYYKEMEGLINYREGATFLIDGSSWEQQIVKDGVGTSYGVELLLRKKTGKTTGWLGYTLAKTDRTFSDLNGGRPFPYKYDRRHDISIVLQHQMSPRSDLFVNWVYGTGNTLTLPTGIFPSTDFPLDIIYSTDFLPSNFFELPMPASANVYRNRTVVMAYEGVNNARVPDYHRLDLGVNFHKPTKWGEQTISISVYNFYARKNPFFVTLGYEAAHSFDLNAKASFQVATLFTFIPSISYQFKLK